MSAPNKNYDPVEVTALSPGEIERALDEAQAAIGAARNLDELKAARLAHAGDRAPLTQARAEIGALPPEARADAGKRVGVAQGQVKAAIGRRQAELEKERDERVLIVDPATGSGAYPLAVVADTLERAPGAAQLLAQRMCLFEPLAGAARLARAHGLDVAECDVLATPMAIDAPIVVCLGNPPYRRARRTAAPPDFVAGGWVPGAPIGLATDAPVNS